MIIADFSKKTWSRRIKHKIYKNQLSMKEISRNIDFFWGKKQNWWKGTLAGTHFYLRKSIIQHIFSFDQIFTNKLYRPWPVFFSPFLSDFNQISKNKCSIRMNRTFGAIFSPLLYVTVYCQRRADYFSVAVFLGKNSNFFVTATPSPLPKSFFLMKTIVFICFSVFKIN